MPRARTIAKGAVGGLLTALIMTMLTVVGTSPAAATGGSTIWLTPDREWRTIVFNSWDNTIPDACPGPTTQKIRLTIRAQAGPRGFWVKNIRIKNVTNGVTFDYRVDWDGRYKEMLPRLPAWTNGVQKKMYNPAWVANGSAVKSYQDWSNRTGLHTLVLENGGGTGCWPVYQLIFKKRA